MNIMDIRKKKQRKQQELKSIKKEYRTITRGQWVRFSLFVCLLIIVVVWLIK